MKHRGGERGGKHSPEIPREAHTTDTEAELFAIEHGEATMDVDLHEMDLWDAEQECERAIDAAFYAGERGVRIVHGVGTGALRKLVREKLLPRNPLIETWRPTSFPHASSAVVVLIRRRT